MSYSIFKKSLFWLFILLQVERSLFGLYCSPEYEDPPERALFCLPSRVRVNTRIQAEIKPRHRQNILDQMDIVCSALSLCFSVSHTHTHYQDEIDQALIYTSQFHSPPPSPRLQRTTFSCRERLSSAAPIGKFPAKFCNSERGSCFSADEVRFGHAGLALPSTI